MSDMALPIDSGQFDATVDEAVGFDNLCRRRFVPMVCLAFVVVHTQEEAEEVVQDVFAALLPRFRRIENRTRICAEAFSMAPGRFCGAGGSFAVGHSHVRSIRPRRSITSSMPCGDSLIVSALQSCCASRFNCATPRSPAHCACRSAPSSPHCTGPLPGFAWR